MNLNNIDWNGVVCTIAMIAMMIMITRTLNKVSENGKQYFQDSKK